MQIKKLVEKINYKLLAGSLDTEITSLVYDSRKIKPGAIFVCIAGTVRDGHDFIPEMMGKGAVAFVVERDDVELVEGFTYILVENTRIALAELAAAYFDYPAEKLKPVELATNSFGQSFNATATQMVAGFASLINGGNYYKPHVVASIVDSAGVTVRENDPLIVRKTVSESTSEFLKEAFYQTVEGGTASKAKVSGYLVGGKTGTAQKLPRKRRRPLRERSDRRCRSRYPACRLPGEQSLPP